MPLYEYTCEMCGHRFEYLARTLSDRPTSCPTCGKETLKKAFSTFAAKSTSEGCAHAGQCAHAHGPGCGCCCH